MKRPLATIWLVLLTAAGGAETKLKPFSLDGNWTLVPDPDNRGIAGEWAGRGVPPEATRVSVRVPGVWQRHLPGYQGAAFYETVFKLPPKAGPQIILGVGSANYRAEGWLNGVAVGTHDGGYTPIEWDLTEAALPGKENRLVIRIVHSGPGTDTEATGLTRIPSSKETWYFPYAGITGPVTVRYAPDPRVTGITVIPEGKLDRIRILVRLAGSGLTPFSGQLTFGVGDRRTKIPLKIPAGTTWFETAQVFPLRGIKPWTLEKPAVYQLNVMLSAGQKVLEVRFARFGMRTIDLKDGYLVLNGKRVQIRGVLLQPNWPVTLAQPADAKSAIRELEQIRAAGFNLVRSHLKPLNPDQLEWCDAHGLMVYEETPVAWMSEDDATRAYEIARRETREMITAHRNHPSIVIWGLSNENGRFACVAGGTTGCQLLGECARLDPTRPAIDVSGWSMNIYPQGGWMNETHVIRPGGASGSAKGIAGGDSPGATTTEFIEDHHHYLRAPVGRDEYDILRFLGDPGRMPSYEAAGYGPAGRETVWKERLKTYTKGIFVSEFGVGGLGNFDAVAGGYRDFRAQEAKDDSRRKDGPLPPSATGLVDEEYYSRIGEALGKEFAEHGMQAEFGSVTGFIESTQHQQALGVSRQVEAMRRNPRVSGYILTQWNDASWECDAGVVDVWRNPKQVAAELPRLNAPWLIVPRVGSRIVEPGVPGSVNISLVGPGPLPREAKLEYLLTSPDATPGAKVVTAKVGADFGGRQASPAELAPLAAGAGEKWEPIRLAADGEAVVPLPGLPDRERWLVRVRLKQKKKILATAAEPVYSWNLKESSQISFALAGESPEISAAYGGWLIPQEYATVLVAARPAAAGWQETFNLLSAVYAGKKAVFMDLGPEDVEAINTIPGLPWKLSLAKTICTFQGYFHFFRGTRFSGKLPGVGPMEPGRFLAGEPYADYLPVWSLPELAGATIHAGAWGTDRLGFESEEAKYAHMRGWHADIMEVPYGKGRILFCQYRLAKHLNEPLARNLFYRLLAI
jgi:hypothetical protein